jgi:hypothetical protein
VPIQILNSKEGWSLQFLMIFTLIPKMFWSFDIRILNIVSGFEIRISDLHLLKIILFDKVIIYFLITMITTTPELTAAFN